MSKTLTRRKFIVPSADEDRQIVAAARKDPDAQPLTTEQLRAMVPLKSLRGRPRSAAPKRLVSVRYSPNVIDYFKSTGEGWQARMDKVLCNYIARKQRSGSAQITTAQ